LISRKASTPNPARYRRAIVLDQRVYAFDQPQKQRPPLGLLVIEGDALLVAVDVAETRVALAAVAPGARRIPFARAFDLDDFRTHLGQDHRAERSGHGSVRSSTFSPCSGPSRSAAARTVTSL
jgi:hypothetical protein